jgi:hypothetical protein
MPTTASRTRWSDARDAVYAAVLANQNFAWGLKLFPNGPDECGLDPDVEVPVGFGSGPALEAAIEPAGPPEGALGAGTPTAAAIGAATAYLKKVTTALPKYIVLVTDGEPNCADNPLFGMSAEMIAVNTIADTAAAGFKTFVIGIGISGIATLNEMAIAGGRPRTGEPRFYPADNRAELDAALETITRAVTTCAFPLVTRPLDPDFVSVTAGSSLIPRDPTQVEGWDYTMGGTAIEIHGSHCEALKTGKTLNVGVYFGCPN